jgi:renalase
MAQQEERIRLLLPDLIRQIPGLGGMSGDDLKPLSLGMMRWGAAQPMDHPLPEDLQWCPASGIGFCGDWIEGPGFGRAEGALLSSVALAEQLAASHSMSKPVI